MPQVSISDSPRQPHLRLVREDEPHDTADSPREWRPMMPPELYAPEVGPDGIAVYGVLALHVNGQTGECWPSQTVIGARIGISRERVIKALRRLERAGFVEVTHQEDRGMKRSNLYRLPHQIHANVQMSQIPTTLSQNGTADVPNPDSRCPKMGHELNVIEPDDKEPDGDTPLPPQGGKRAVYPTDFETFWTQYPSGHGNKKKAAEAWKKLRPDAETQADMMAGLARWNACGRWRRGYVKDAVVWIKDRWWEDEPPKDDDESSLNGKPPRGESPVDFFIRAGRGEA